MIFDYCLPITKGNKWIKYEITNSKLSSSESPRKYILNLLFDGNYSRKKKMWTTDVSHTSNSCTYIYILFCETKINGIGKMIDIQLFALNIELEIWNIQPHIDAYSSKVFQFYKWTFFFSFYFWNCFDTNEEREYCFLFVLNE